MSLGNAAENSLLSILFQNVNWSGIGDAGGLGGSTTAGNLYVSLHTGALTGASDQSTNEAAYTGYARVAVARSAGGWTISGSSPTQAANTAAITFPTCTGGSETEVYFAVGTSPSGPGQILYYGALVSSLAVSNNITPSFAVGALVCTVL